MFATSSLVVLISAAAVMASTHGARTHNAIAAAKRENNTFSIGKRDQYNNKEFTWYPTDTGPDACTGQNHQDSDFYVAMGYNQYGDGSACCNRQLSITVNGKTATATCVDECASCPDVGQLDFTKGLFEYFSNGDLDVGVLYGSWSYADGSGSSGGDDGGDSDTTTTTKKTTTSTKHTTTSTTTHKTTTSTTHTPTTTSTSTTTTHTSEKPSSSKASSSAKPSSSSVHSSSVVESSSSSALPKSSSSSPSAAPLPTAEATQGVANAGSSAGGSSADSDGDDTGISGAIGTGGSSSDAVSLSFNKLFATIAVVVLVAAQAF
ncbi:hypothetical protein MSAN_00812400 [Mycena sanguinolenta]|uniref:RlpA-like double-psi beta-barrel-protein domain-containing protein-containing protein n=1 Tax=Mycena sanguinolenta TaxID=230812 RepID=A0A8H7DAN8_9AGAR|nr:hypothetical protein MSAN_00812400 [Mycena sanguinolenta]